MDIVGRNSILAAQGTSHTRLKSFITRAIDQPDALRRIAIKVQPRVASALRSWAEKGTVVAYNEVKKVTFENIGKLFANLEPSPVLDTLDEMFDGMLMGIRSYPINFPGTPFHHGIQCRNKAIGIFREELERRKMYQNSDNTTKDVMDGLMLLKDDEGKQLDDIEVIDNILGLVVAGYETTSISITWTLYYLAKYPHVLQKLREEHMPLRKEKDGEFITSDEITKLRYTYQVVEEIIRLANIASTIFRTAAKDVEYKGYKIPKGWKVILWARYLHTDPENFEDPLCFKPERWNEPAKPGTFQVFGGGSRICAGNMLARLQIAIFVHHLAAGCKWELVNPNAEVTYLPHPKPVDGVEIAISKLGFERTLVEGQENARGSVATKVALGPLQSKVKEASQPSETGMETSLINALSLIDEGEVSIGDSGQGNKVQNGSNDNSHLADLLPRSGSRSAVLKPCKLLPNQGVIRWVISIKERVESKPLGIKS
ncbi:unnamed protein product [Ilex paraguariensis]|uniref:Ent-kaurenoic acid oxidase n=1 Tax=Ilex paraguariensis TaxID=185542 RepID=A0ABC8TEW2_9AQUA